MSSLDFEKNQGVMSSGSVNGGLVFYFLEMAKGKAVLFLEMGQIKGDLEKIKIFSFPFSPFLLALPRVFL